MVRRLWWGTGEVGCFNGVNGEYRDNGEHKMGGIVAAPPQRVDVDGFKGMEENVRVWAWVAVTSSLGIQSTV